VPVLKNAKHEAFVQAYLISSNGKQAYLKVYGGDEKVAEANASRLLRDAKVMTRLVELRERAAVKLEISQDKVLRRLAEIAFGHIGMICTWNETSLEVKPSESLTEQEMAAIDFVDISPVSDGDGGLLGYRKKIKMRDALKALEMLSKYLGLFDGAGAKGKDRETIKARLVEIIEEHQRRRSESSP